MKKILVLGAGMVAGAHIRYLLAIPGFHVTVASRTLEAAMIFTGPSPTTVDGRSLTHRPGARSFPPLTSRMFAALS